VRHYRLGEEPARDPRDASTVDERLQMMWSLAREGWSIAGRAMPMYDRASMPGVLVRGSR
jgi:hypothetical protein